MWRWPWKVKHVVKRGPSNNTGSFTLIYYFITFINYCTWREVGFFAINFSLNTVLKQEQSWTMYGIVTSFPIPFLFIHHMISELWNAESCLNSKTYLKFLLASKQTLASLRFWTEKVETEQELLMFSRHLFNVPKVPANFWTLDDFNQMALHFLIIIWYAGWKRALKHEEEVSLFWQIPENHKSRAKKHFNVHRTCIH